MKLICTLLLHFVIASLCYAQGYYPLEIGNRWDYGYLDTPGHFVYQRTVSVLSDTVMPNGKRYAVLSDGGYLRQQGDTVYDYSPIHGEIVLYDFSRQSGDTIITYYPNDTLTTIVYRGPSDVFGKSRTVWNFYTRSSASSFYSFINIADSVGYIYGQWEPGENEYCLGAIINGIQYGTITAVAFSNDILPTRYVLSQNYPNPFNPTTLISYSVPVQAYITLSVYDFLGRVVSVLREGVHDPGKYEIRFNGSKLSSGVYFYRLHAGSFIETRKMIFMK